MKNSIKIRFLCAAASVGLLAGLPAVAAQVVVVGAKSSVTSLSAEQVSQLFLAKSSTLPGGERAVLIDQAEGSPTREAFYVKATGKNAAQMKALWSRLVFSGTAQPPKEAGGNAEVKKMVAETAGAIGYIDKSAVDASVKVVFSID